MHRSGTSWLGRMLTLGDDTVGVQEPLNPRNRNTILRSRVERWYTYISRHNEAEYLPYYRDAVAFRPHPLQDVARMRLVSPRDPFRVLQHWRDFGVGRVQGRRLLIRDPFAVFSIPWFVERVGCRVVVIVREPAAVASSMKRLGWTFDFRDLLEQPELMDERLPRFRSEIEAATTSPEDGIGQGSRLWNIIYGVVDEFRQSVPDLCVVRHEDLSLDPIAGFSSLYDLLGLSFADETREKIAEFTGGGNPTEVTLSNPFDVRLDSRRNLENWKRRLAPAEIERVRELTEDVRRRFYPEEPAPAQMSRTTG